jgi:hypothetical protein
MEKFVIGANLESAAARGNQRERFDALAELKNFGRQTDGLRRVVSDYAVFDRHLGFHQRAPFRERKYRCDQMRSRNVREIAAFARDAAKEQALDRRAYTTQKV